MLIVIIHIMSSINLNVFKMENDKSINLSQIQQTRGNNNYKHEWYTKNTNKVKDYNKKYYQEHKKSISL
jgi:hypothetical protein